MNSMGFNDTSGYPESLFEMMEEISCKVLTI